MNKQINKIRKKRKSYLFPVTINLFLCFRFNLNIICTVNLLSNGPDFVFNWQL